MNSPKKPPVKQPKINGSAKRPIPWSETLRKLQERGSKKVVKKDEEYEVQSTSFCFTFHNPAFMGRVIKKG